MAAPTLTTEVQKVESWLKTHERLLIVVILALSTLYLGDKFLTGIENRDRAAATQAAQILTIQQTANATLAAQVAIAQKNNQDLIVQLSQQNAILQTQQAQRTVVLTQQVATDKTLPLPDLGNRWAKLAGLNPGDITATTAGISVTPQGALSTTTTLEQLPVAQANVADLSTQNKNLVTEIASETTLNTQKDSEITGLNIAAVDASKSCKADIASAKAQARKGKFKAFLYGAGVGVGVTVALVLHAVL